MEIFRLLESNHHSTKQGHQKALGRSHLDTRRWKREVGERGSLYSYSYLPFHWVYFLLKNYVFIYLAVSNLRHGTGELSSWSTGSLVVACGALWHVCIARWVLNHWTTEEVPELLSDCCFGKRMRGRARGTQQAACLSGVSWSSVCV